MEDTVIIRRSKKNNFVVMDKTALTDKNISWKAKGLFAYMLTLPEDWKFYSSELKNHSKDGKDSTNTGLNELIDNGYISRKPIKNKGKFEGFVYTLHEIPLRIFRNGKTAAENPQLLNTNRLNNHKELKKEKEELINHEGLKQKRKKVAPKKEESFRFVYVFHNYEHWVKKFQSLFGYMPNDEIYTEIKNFCMSKGYEKTEEQFLYYSALYIGNKTPSKGIKTKKGTNVPKDKKTSVEAKLEAIYKELNSKGLWLPRYNEMMKEPKELLNYLNSLGYE